MSPATGDKLHPTLQHHTPDECYGRKARAENEKAAAPRKVRGRFLCEGFLRCDSFGGNHFGLHLIRVDRDSALGFGAFEFDLAVNLAVDREVVAEANVHAGVELRATLADDDAAWFDDLTARCFDASVLRLRVAAVSG